MKTEELKIVYVRVRCLRPAYFVNGQAARIGDVHEVERSTALDLAHVGKAEIIAGTERLQAIPLPALPKWDAKRW